VNAIANTDKSCIISGDGLGTVVPPLSWFCHQYYNGYRCPIPFFLPKNGQSRVIPIVAFSISVFLGLMLINNIRPLFGVFTGTYLAITVHPDQPILIEIVECKHTGKKLNGKIHGVSFVDYEGSKLVELQPNTGQYKFTGTVAERLFVLSYYTTTPGLKNSGTLTLQGDSAGRRFIGIWAGYTIDSVSSSPCIWVRINDDSTSPVTNETLLKTTEWILAGYGLPDMIEEKLSSDRENNNISEGENLIEGKREALTVKDKFEFPSSRDTENRKRSLHKQWVTHQDNLNKLEEQAALHGVINVPLELQNEIKAVKIRIGDIEEELKILDERN